MYRVQLRVTTANIKDASTDDAVMVRLGSGPGTWIDSSADDHQRGRTYLYDLIPQTTGNQGMRIRDITMLNVSKTGSDGWCIGSLELIVNGGVIYQATYPRGQWLDNSKGKTRTHTIASSTLRASRQWKQYKNAQPSPVIPQLELEQRIESIIGHYIHDEQKLQWGKLSGRGVEVTFKDHQTLHVDLDLKIAIKNFPDAALDVDFDIEVTTRNGAIDLTAKNIQAHVTSKLHQTLLAANGLAGGTNQTKLNRMITKQIRQSLGGRPVSVSTGNLNLTALVTAGGNVVLLPQR